MEDEREEFPVRALVAMLVGLTLNKIMLIKTKFNDGTPCFIAAGLGGSTDVPDDVDRDALGIPQENLARYTEIAPMAVMISPEMLDSGLIQRPKVVALGKDARLVSLKNADEVAVKLAEDLGVDFSKIDTEDVIDSAADRVPESLKHPSAGERSVREALVSRDAIQPWARGRRRNRARR